MLSRSRDCSNSAVSSQVEYPSPEGGSNQLRYPSSLRTSLQYRVPDSRFIPQRIMPHPGVMCSCMARNLQAPSWSQVHAGMGQYLTGTVSNHSETMPMSIVLGIRIATHDRSGSQPSSFVQGGVVWLPCTQLKHKPGAQNAKLGELPLGFGKTTAWRHVIRPSNPVMTVRQANRALP